MSEERTKYNPDTISRQKLESYGYAKARVISKLLEWPLEVVLARIRDESIIEDGDYRITVERHDKSNEIYVVIKIKNP